MEGGEGREREGGQASVNTVAIMGGVHPDGVDVALQSSSRQVTGAPEEQVAGGRSRPGYAPRGSMAVEMVLERTQEVGPQRM